MIYGNILRILSIGVLTLVVLAATATADEPLRILFIGNSFTQGGPIPTLVGNIAVAAGWARPDAVNAAVSGQTLQYHTTYAPTLAYIDQGDWDYVVLQEYSTRPTDSTVGNANPLRFKQDATFLYDRVKVASPDAIVVLYETWARHESLASFYPAYYANRDAMQDQLNFHYHDAAENYIPSNSTAADKDDILLAPCGEAWGANYHDQNIMLHGGDMYHAGPLGQYLNALVIYGTIYDRKVERLPISGDPATYTYLYRLADEATGASLYGGPNGYTDPTLAYSCTRLGDGLYGWTFRICNNDGLMMSYTVSLAFQGTDEATVRQMKANNGLVNVNKEGWIEWDAENEEFVGEGARFYDQVDPSYDMERDTWVFNPFGDNPVTGIHPLTGGNITGIINGINLFLVSCYSGTGSALSDNVNVAYVVANGNVAWTGTIFRNGSMYPVSGVTEVPAILGDFNGDGSVTHGDYTVWADNYGDSIADVQASHPGWFPVGSFTAGAIAITHGLYTTWADHFGDTADAPLTVGQSSMPAAADAPATAVARAERVAARKQLRLQRSERRQQRRLERVGRRR